MSLVNTLAGFWLPKSVLAEAARLESLIEKISNLKPLAIPIPGNPTAYEAGFDTGQKDFRNRVLMLLHGNGYRLSKDGASVTLPERILTSGPLPVPSLGELLEMREREISSLKSQVSWLKKIEDSNDDLIADLRSKLDHAEAAERIRSRNQEELIRDLQAQRAMLEQRNLALTVDHNSRSVANVGLKKMVADKDQTIQVWKDRFNGQALVADRLYQTIGRVKQVVVNRHQFLQHEAGQRDMWNRVQSALTENPCAEVSAWNEYAPYKAVVDQVYQNKPADNLDLTLTVKVKVNVEIEDAC